MKLNKDQKTQIQDLINETILPALYEDIDIPDMDDLSEEEFEAARDALLSYLIEQLSGKLVRF